MPVQITKADAKRAMDRVASMKQRAAKMAREMESRVEKVVRTFEVGGTAFAAGLMQGKTGGVEVLGVPLELGGGLLLELFGHMGLAGKASDHLINVGDGALAAYATTLGRGVGQEWQATGHLTGGTKSSGSLGSGSALSPAEAAAAAQMARQMG